jgi:hypothetical protein
VPPASSKARTGARFIGAPLGRAAPQLARRTAYKVEAAYWRLRERGQRRGNAGLGLVFAIEVLSVVQLEHRSACLPHGMGCQRARRPQGAHGGAGGSGLDFHRCGWAPGPKAEGFPSSIPTLSNFLDTYFFVGSAIPIFAGHPVSWSQSHSRTLRCCYGNRAGA